MSDPRSHLGSLFEPSSCMEWRPNLQQQRKPDDGSGFWSKMSDEQLSLPGGSILDVMKESGYTDPENGTNVPHNGTLGIKWPDSEKAH